MKKKKKVISKFLKSLLTIFLVFLTIFLFCLNNYGKSVVEKSSVSDFKTHEKYTEFDDIPANIVNAIIEIEDNTFWTNDGINIKGTGRAILTILKTKGKEIPGGSGITQQLVKNVFLNQDVKISRKIKEAAIAVKFDEKYTKKQTIEFYLNNSYFGNGVYTIAGAADLYFSKTLPELTLSESAYLCALLNSPNEFDPFVDSSVAVSRRNMILEEMLSSGKIAERDYNEAVSESIRITNF